MNGYADLMARRGEILHRSALLDYAPLETGSIAFDYEGLMRSTGYSRDDVRSIQFGQGVGGTPLLELKRVTELVRRISKPGHGATILVKDEAANPSGSFKDRRASLSAFHAKANGFKGLVAATSGNYGAAVASQAAKIGLRAIIVQEVFDSRGVGQPEILEKGRRCEAYGAEVLQATVGPELFFLMLRVIDETGFFNASLYTPFSVQGIETLGYELVEQTRDRYGKDPSVVLITHAGGGNVTGTARGLQAAACHARVVAVSVDLSGLHMASDRDFNRKSFTTGHTGFGVPFATKPDRADVPRNAARPLRYMDRYVTVTQGEVFYVTEMLARLEGLERGPAGNTSLAAAVMIAQELADDEILVVQETEYTGAGKHPHAQLTFAREQGVEVRRGDPVDSVPGKVIVIPEDVRQIRARDVDLDRIREGYLRPFQGRELGDADLRFLAEETRLTLDSVTARLGILKSPVL